MANENDGIRICTVRVANFRSLENVELDLGAMTILVGANNSGKTSFLDALNLALGIGRRPYGQDDILTSATERQPPRTRRAVVDILIRPVDDDGNLADVFPEGSFWTNLWGQGISQDESAHDFMAFRTTLAWDAVKGEYGTARKFLKEFLKFDAWLTAEEKSGSVASSQIEPISLHYMDAKRDLDDDLHRAGSFWRRLTDDLGLQDAEVVEFEQALSELNDSIMEKSEVLKHLKENLGDLRHLIAAEGAGIDIAPVARKLRDLSKGVDVNFSSAGSAPFPLTRHGMGTRSLASLLVFRAYVSWKTKHIATKGDRLHPVLALEEPEAHLHPQAQRALYGQIQAIPGQRLVSTHSAYYSAQAGLKELRFFSRKAGVSVVRQLNVSALQATEQWQLQRQVIATRGDLVFSRALILFEGETEEQAIPLWAEHYIGENVHKLGFSFIGVGGLHYFPFVWLAQELGISWYVFSDGETTPVKTMHGQLKRAGVEDPQNDKRVFVLEGKRNLERELLHEGYAAEVEQGIAVTEGETWLDEYVETYHGQAKKKGVMRDYKGGEGRAAALADAMEAYKTSCATNIAKKIVGCATTNRQIPKSVRVLLDELCKEFNLSPKLKIDG